MKLNANNINIKNKRASFDYEISDTFNEARKALGFP
jgi:tmRNA-binding protein